MYPTILCNTKMTNDTTTAVQHPPKTHLRLPTMCWLRPSGFDKRSCPYVGQWSNPTNRGQFHHDLRSTTFTGREQRFFSSRVITNESLSKPRTTRHTSNCACNLPKPRPHMDCVVQYNSHPKNGSINPGQALSTHSLGDEPPAVAASGAISARAEIPSQKKKSIFNISIKPKISKSTFGTPRTTIRS